MCLFTVNYKCLLQINIKVLNLTPKIVKLQKGSAKLVTLIFHQLKTNIYTIIKINTFPLTNNATIVTAPPCSYVMGGVSDHPPDTSILAGHSAFIHLFIGGNSQDSGLKNWKSIRPVQHLIFKKSTKKMLALYVKSFIPQDYNQEFTKKG